MWKLWCAISSRVVNLVFVMCLLLPHTAYMYAHVEGTADAVSSIFLQSCIVCNSFSNLLCENPGFNLNFFKICKSFPQGFLIWLVNHTLCDIYADWRLFVYVNKPNGFETAKGGGIMPCGAVGAAINVQNSCSCTFISAANANRRKVAHGHSWNCNADNYIRLILLRC